MPDEELLKVLVTCVGIICAFVGSVIVLWIRAARRNHGSTRLLLYGQPGIGSTRSMGPGPDLADPDNVLKAIMLMVTSAGAWVDKDAEITRLLHRHNELREGSGLEKLW